MSKNLYIMMGLPGSGKSYWLSKYALSDKIISRDKIRFEMLKDGEGYFEHEKEVYNKYLEEIQKALDEGGDECHVYADATHINKRSRHKLVYNLITEDVDIHVIFIDTPLSECIKNNRKRKDRALVDDTIIAEFAKRLEPPEDDSKGYRTITRVKTYPRKKITKNS